jgi:hypothetical protein
MNTPGFKGFLEVNDTFHIFYEQYITHLHKMINYIIVDMGFNNEYTDDKLSEFLHARDLRVLEFEQIGPVVDMTLDFLYNYLLVSVDDSYSDKIMESLENYRRL